MTQDDDWPARMARLVAREVRRHRDRRKMSAQQLADRTASLGMGIPRSVLANLESGRRDTVAVAEVLVLAAALGVAPVELFCPAGFDEEIEILPGRPIDPLLASRWVDGELQIDLSRLGTAFVAPEAGEESSTRLLETHVGLIEQVGINDAAAARAATAAAAARDKAGAAEHYLVMAADEEAAVIARERAEAARQTLAAADSELAYKTEAAARYRQTAAQSLQHIRAEMRRRGMLLPPLPPPLDPDFPADGDAR